ncbi:MAG: hypothetical protein M3Y82_02100 [Verrucomicrobiota bacterium]|nr:hypothetical protein [Verrucomicrobiota bacterium]
MSDQKIHEELNRIAELIESSQFIHQLGRIKEWGGADVIITSKPEISELSQKLVIGYVEGNPGAFIAGDFRIVTEHAKSLSWLFYQLRDAFVSRIDFENKYDFYGKLARRAASHLDSKIDGASSAQGLLLAVLDEARKFLK